MTDMLLELGKRPRVRRLIKAMHLPLPLPEALLRERGPMGVHPLADRLVLVAGSGALGAVIARALGAAAAWPVLADPGLRAPFDDAAAEGGHAPKALDAVADERLDALVFDASTLASAAALGALHAALSPLVPRLARSGRVVVLGRPSAGLPPEAAATQAALEGFVRSVAKEIGRTGATANLLVVEPGAEERAGPPLRFLLSARSAFITAQPLLVSARARAAGHAPPATHALAHKTALVTGAARGIGAATARALAAEGAHVLCLDRPADAEATAALAQELGGTPVLADLAEAGAATAIVEAVQARGGVDVLVHNAGITRDKTFARMSRAQWDQVLEVNLAALVRTTDALLPHLREEGRIVCLSSVAGLAGNVGQAAYAASKAGVLGLVRAWAGQLAPRGITVNAVAPGFIETRLTAAIPFAIREAARRLSALGQGGQPEDVAAAITFLASPGAQGVTGSTLRVCGGALVGA